MLFEVPHLRILSWPKCLPIARLRVLLDKIDLPIAELVYSVRTCLLNERVQIGLEHSSLSSRRFLDARAILRKICAFREGSISGPVFTAQ